MKNNFVRLPITIEVNTNLARKVSRYYYKNKLLFIKTSIVLIKIFLNKGNGKAN